VTYTNGTLGGCTLSCYGDGYTVSVSGMCVCAEGYVGKVEYKDGAITGCSVPPATPNPTSETFVVASTMDLTIPMSNSDDVSEVVQNSLADYLGVSADSVRIISVTIKSRRFLASSGSRGLANPVSYVIEFEIILATTTAASSIKTVLTAIKNDPAPLISTVKTEAISQGKISQSDSVGITLAAIKTKKVAAPVSSAGKSGGIVLSVLSGIFVLALVLFKLYYKRFVESGAQQVKSTASSREMVPVTPGGANTKKGVPASPASAL